MQPGEWVMARSGFTLSAANDDVTPHAQKTGTLSSLIVTASPKSTLLMSSIPNSFGSPKCTGGPWAAGKDPCFCCFGGGEDMSECACGTLPMYLLCL